MPTNPNLGTASQWEHVRRLVQMLDYQPSPPASDIHLSGSRRQKRAEGDGGERPAGSRTAPRTGRLRLYSRPWRISRSMPNSTPCASWAGITRRHPFPASSGTSLWMAGEKTEHLRRRPGGFTPGLGDWGCRHEGQEPRQGRYPDPGGSGERQFLARTWKLGEILLEVGGKKVLKPRLNGTDTLQFGEPHGLRQGDLVAWQENELVFRYRRRDRSPCPAFGRKRPPGCSDGPVPGFCR